MDIAKAKIEYTVKVYNDLLRMHYNMLKDRDGWYNPDQDALEEINRDIAKVAKFIETLDEIQEFLD